MNAVRITAIACLLLLNSCGRRPAGAIETSKRNQTANANTVAVERQPSHCVNLNAATAKELEALPGIGEVIAEKIVEYREQAGPFRRPEEVIIVDGMSERKYRAIASQLCVE